MFVKKLTLVTGGFDPIHSGHIEYFKEASKLSEFLVIISHLRIEQNDQILYKANINHY